MQINEKCLPCLVNQVVRVANMAGVQDRHALYHKFFACLAQADFTRSNPELLGEFFRLVKSALNNPDPYHELKLHYDRMFLALLPQFRQRIASARDPFAEAVKYAVAGNLIDFSPLHAITEEQALRAFDSLEEKTLPPESIAQLRADIRQAKTILYIGDNCGEVCLDRLLLEHIRQENPAAQLFFGVRGAPIVNDALEEDARIAGIAQLACIVSNGDDCQGTVLARTSERFQRIYADADVILSKGQANFESLSEDEGNVYFLMTVKCDVISSYTGVPAGSMVCMRRG